MHPSLFENFYFFFPFLFVPRGDETMRDVSLSFESMMGSSSGRVRALTLLSAVAGETGGIQTRRRAPAQTAASAPGDERGTTVVRARAWPGPRNRLPGLRAPVRNV